MKINGNSDKANLTAISITENGHYTPSAGIDGYNSVNVDVAGGGEEILDWGFDFLPDWIINANITGRYVWNHPDGNVYCKVPDTPTFPYHQYRKEGDYWVEDDFGGEIGPESGATIWTDGVNVYSNHIYYNVQTWIPENVSLILNGKTWERKEWNVDIQTAYNIWKTPDGHIYYTGKVGSAMDWSSPTVFLELVNGEWVEKTWSGNIPQEGNYIWDDGVNVYASRFNTPQSGEILVYSLMLQGDTWVEKDWGENIWISGNNVFKLGDDVFHNDGYEGHNYKLVDGNWIPFDFDGVIQQSGQDIWTDGTNYYHNYNAVALIKNRAVRKLNVIKNGEYNAEGFTGWNGVNVNVRPKVQFRQIFENGFYDAQQEGFDGYQAVEVNVAGGYSLKEVLQGNWISPVIDTDAEYIRPYGLIMIQDIQGINLPECRFIGSHALQYCSNLTNVYAPMVDTVDNDAFVGCANLSNIELQNCINLNQYAFRSCPNLTSVSLPMAENIGSFAFNLCSSLTSVYAPMVKTIYDHAFGNTHLTSIDFPMVETIGSFAFASCSYLTNVNLPVCNNVGESAFTYCSRLTNFNLPNCTVLSSFALTSCASLTSINLPNCNSVGAYAFSGCYKLTNVNLQNCSFLDMYAFYRCSSLTTLNLPKCDTIRSVTFSGCTKLKTVSMGYDGVVSLLNSNAFTGCTALTSIYVPASLVDSYKTAANWSYFASKIVPIA